MADPVIPRFTDNAAIRGREDHYAELTVETVRILESWRESLFSYEWLKPDGKIKATNDLPPNEQARRQAVEQQLGNNTVLEKPVLGIGLLDNVEIGAGRAVFLTLAANGVATIPVHVPKSHIGEFQSFIPGAKPAKATRKVRSKNESGNVLFYILMAVVVLAALIAAVARSGRDSISFLSSDQQRLLATEILAYSDSVVKMTSQMRLRGVQFNQIRFSAPTLPSGYGVYNTSPSNEIFNPAGGALNYRPPPANAMKITGDYTFVAANAVNQVGTTCTNASCVELMLIAGPLKPEICSAINNLLGLNASANTPPVAVSHIETGTLFAGTATYSATLGGTIPTAALDSQMAACITDSGTGFDYFYQVLLPQ